MTEPAPLLMTPGPTRVPERVLHAGARPMIHHRSPEFSAELAELLQLLQPIFGTHYPILPVHTTGRGAMEASICNLFSPGDEIAFVCNGQFGEMWARIAQSYGLIVHRIATKWENDVAVSEIDDLFLRHQNIRAIGLAYCDTSTGVRNDVEAVARAARAHNALVLVDGVSSLGGMPFAFDEWEVDVAVTASQKCLMASPGMAFVALSERAWQAQSSSRLPRNYFDFPSIRNSVTKPRPETPGTTPVHLVLQLAESLRMIHEEGVANVQRRHEETALIARNGCKELGIAVQCPELKHFAATVTALVLPPDVAPRALRDKVRAQGILIAAGLDHYEPTGFRIGHMGDIRAADVEQTLAAIGMALGQLSS